MATVFPFNKVSQIPSIILKQVLPLVFKQQQLKLNINLEMDSFNLSMSKTAKCDDAEVLALKNKLAELQKAIDQLNAILQILPVVVTAFRTISTIATVISTIQLAIPTVPPAPAGPTSQTISSFADLIANINAAVSTLNNIVSLMKPFSDQISKSISEASDKISNICNSPVNSNNTLTSPTQPNSMIPDSVFYRSVNVSDDDLNQRLQEIQLLIDNGFNVLASINEAPSKVIVGEGVPTNSIGQPGDYYINTLNQSVVGPKLQTNSWN